jgi:hypothetical protein
MSFGFVNLLMLAGLAAVALPLLVHLISRRKFDVVHWGAMQFLELGRRTRRRIRLEELLLMLLRMGLIGLVVFALARPWAKGGLFARLGAKSNEDVVFILDGSYSMGWEGKAVTPDAAARQWVHDDLEALSGGDTVAVLDARDQVRAVIDSPTGDFDYVRQQVDALPDPSGTSNLGAALVRALQILSRSSNVSRSVVVLTDGQALPWQLADEGLWARIDDLRKQPAVEPRIFVVDVTGEGAKDRTNFAVGAVQLSRELTVPDFPIRIKTTVSQSGGVSTRRQVHFEVDGQRLADKTLSLNLPPNGEVTVEFEHRFPAVGSYVVSVVLDADNLPGDNRADAAVHVTSGVPVLLVDGVPHLDPTRRETFFAKAALSAAGNKAPWVTAAVVDAAQFGPQSLEGREVVFLCNVPRLSDAQLGALREFVSRGGGLIVAPGDAVDKDFYNGPFFDAGNGLLPATLESIQSDAGNPLGPVNVEDESLDLPWIARFKRGTGVDFAEARLARWWKLAESRVESEESRDPPASSDDVSSQSPIASPPLVHARLDTREAFIIGRNYGDGAVLELACPVDTDWSTLPAKNDFVPFLHEMVFLLASRTSGRNVDVGLPLILPLTGDQRASEWTFIDPDGRAHAAEAWGDAPHPKARLLSTELPGVYRAVRMGDPAARPEFFVVNFDRTESDLTPLEAIDTEQLTARGRMRFIQSVEDLQAALAGDAPRTELWRLLLLVVLVILVAEVLMTRKLVRGGHEAVDAPEEEVLAGAGRA